MADAILVVVVVVVAVAVAVAVGASGRGDLTCTCTWVGGACTWVSGGGTCCIWSCDVDLYMKSNDTHTLEMCDFSFNSVFICSEGRSSRGKKLLSEIISALLIKFQVKANLLKNAIKLKMLSNATLPIWQPSCATRMRR